MRPWLLDVNCLVALGWRRHMHHDPARRWFEKQGAAGFRTCPFTQCGFVRVLSNPKVTPGAQPVEAVREVLSRIVAMPEHEFWAGSLTWADVDSVCGPLLGHQQVTDAYLLALAKAHGGRLVTFDRGIASLRGAEGVVEVLG